MSTQEIASFTEREAEQKALDQAASASVLAEWPPEADAVLRKARDGKRTIAIVGFSPTSRHLAPFDDERVTIWGVNEAHRHQSAYMKRWDGWWQIHKRWDFTKGSSIATKEHWAWLQQDQGVPIYMQEKWDDIPSSVAYPLDAVKQAFPGVAELIPTGEAIERDYYTSTFAYMCAMAMYQIEQQDLPGRIEIYGFDMATWTEFGYQKGSTEFWIGYARGRGHEVTVPYKCRLMNGKLYGYEISRIITKDALQKLLDVVIVKREEWFVKVQEISQRRADVEKRAMAEKDIEARNKIIVDEARPLFNQEIEFARETNAAHGEVQEYQDLIAYIDKSSVEDQEFFLNRQLIDFRMTSINRDRQSSMNSAMVMRGRRSIVQQEVNEAMQKAITDEERDEIEKKGAEVFNNEFNAASLVNALYGRAKVVTNLLKYLDNMDADDQLVKAIIEADPLGKAEGE